MTITEADLARALNDLSLSSKPDQHAKEIFAYVQHLWSSERFR